MKRRCICFLLMGLLAYGVGCGGLSEKEVFVDCLTENGSGLAREVEADREIAEYRRTKYMALDDNQADLRWFAGNLSEEEKALLFGNLPHLTFNEETVLPEETEEVFPAQTILEQGKSPGLGVGVLHEKGITGKGVGIAIIDQVLYTNHPEYASKLALYEEIHVVPGQRGSMHGGALASIAVGDSCGVAPGAKLYYWALDNVKSWRRTDEDNTAWEEYARAIDRVVEVNRGLPDTGKIRVIAIARGYDTVDEENNEGLRLMAEAIERAGREGIFVVTTSTEKNLKYFAENRIEIPFAGLGKIDPAKDPDLKDNYTLGSWQWASPEDYEQSLLIPMDDRTTADMSGDTYVHYADGGWSWTVPYIAGVYALCVQVEPKITPEEFYEAAMKTAVQITRSRTPGGKSYTFHMIDPPALIEYLQKGE